MTTANPNRPTISSRVRALRLERRWTQKALALELGLSQSRLSEIESGQGTFSAEQFLRVLEVFNVTVDRFAARKSGVASQLQNALSRLGAAHLSEGSEVLPSELLKEAAAVIRETLLAPESPRQVAGLAPVLVNHAQGVNFSKLQTDLAAVGRERRLYWLVDIVREALNKEETALLAREWRVRYRRAATLLDFAAQPWRIYQAAIRVEQDIFDADIASDKTVAEIQGQSSEISRRWNIVTRLEVDDFVGALRDARESS